jgi:hypothetical protein
VAAPTQRRSWARERWRRDAGDAREAGRWKTREAAVANEWIRFDRRALILSHAQPLVANVYFIPGSGDISSFPDATPDRIKCHPQRLMNGAGRRWDPRAARRG